MGIFATILGIPGLIGGLFGTLNGITSALSNAKIAAINATTEAQRIKANEAVLTLQARRDVMVAEAAHSPINGIVRALLSLGVVLILWKILVWDKVIGSFMGCAGLAGQAPACATFRTDVLSPEIWHVVMIVMGFYFLYDASTSITRIFASKK